MLDQVAGPQQPAPSGTDIETSPLITHLRSQDAARALLVLGPAGSGKSRLARRLAVDLGRENTRERAREPILVNLAGGSVTALTGLLLSLRTPARPSDIDRVAQGDRPASLGVVEALANGLREACRPAPITVVFDNLDRADGWWWTLLRLLLERTRTVPWRAIVCARDTWPENRTHQELDRLPGWVAQFPVRPLGPEAVAELIAEQAGAIADGQLIDVAIARLGRAAGAPGAVVGLVRSLDEGSRLSVAHGRVYLRQPSAPIELADDHPEVRRIDLLGPACRSVHSVVCAVDGIRVDDIEHVARALDMPADDVASAVDDLVRADLLTEAGGLLRAAVPAAGVTAALGCPPDQARRLAQALLTADSGEHPSPAVGPNGHSRRAELFVRARPETVDPGLANELIDAARQYGADDPARAADWCAAIAAAAGRESDLAEQAVSTELRLRAAANQWTNCHDVARHLLGDPRSSVPTRVSAYLHLTLALAELGRLAEATDELDAARADLPAALHPAIDQQRARLLIATGHFASARLALADSPVTAGTDWPSAFGAAVLAAIGGDTATFTVIIDDLTRSGIVTVGPTERASAVDAIVAGDFRGADMILIPAANPPAGVRVCYTNARVALFAGRWDDADRAACAVPRFAPAGLARTAATLTYVMAAEACLRRGDPDTAANWLHLTDPDLPFGFLVAWARCGLLMARRELAAAADLATTAVVAARDQGHGAGLGLLALRGIEAATLAGGCPDDSPLWSEVMLPRPDDSPLTRYCALLAQAMRASDAALAQAAAGAARAAGFPYEQAKAHARAADLGDPSELRTAYRIFDLLGADAERATCALLLRRADVPVPGRVAAAGELSTRERQIGQLVALGYTNGQIGRRLGMPAKTVEASVTRLIRLAGVRSRVGLAVAWVGGGLADGPPAGPVTPPGEPTGP